MTKITDRDKGAKALMKRLQAAAERSRVTVGVHEEDGSAKHSGSDATIAEVMSFHELGLGVPRRSFIADWFDEDEEKNKAAFRKIGAGVFAGKFTPEQGLDRFGVYAVGQIQKRIRDGIEPELADATVDAKGSSTPLIDTGEGWSSIRHKVGGSE